MAEFICKLINMDKEWWVGPCTSRKVESFLDVELLTEARQLIYGKLEKECHNLNLFLHQKCQRYMNVLCVVFFVLLLLLDVKIRIGFSVAILHHKWAFCLMWVIIFLIIFLGTHKKLQYCVYIYLLIVFSWMKMVNHGVLNSESLHYCFSPNMWGESALCHAAWCFD